MSEPNDAKKDPKLATTQPIRVKPAKYRMPRPTSLVLWSHVPGGEATPAVVTLVGQAGVSLVLFPPESRAGVPKEAVRHASDPTIKDLINPTETGVWDYTPEHKLLVLIAGNSLEGPDGGVDSISKADLAIYHSLRK